MTQPSALTLAALLAIAILGVSVAGLRGSSAPGSSGCGAGAAVVVPVVEAVGKVGACILSELLTGPSESTGQVLAKCVGAAAGDVIAIAAALLQAYEQPAAEGGAPALPSVTLARKATWRRMVAGADGG